LKTSNKNLESWNERRSHNIVGTPGHVLLFEAVMNGKDRYALANNDSQRLLLVKRNERKQTSGSGAVTLGSG